MADSQLSITDLVEAKDPLAYYQLNDEEASSVIEDFTGTYDATVYKDAVSLGGGSLLYQRSPLVNEFSYQAGGQSYSIGFKGDSDSTRAGIDLPSSFNPTYDQGFTFEAWVYLDPTSKTNGVETLFQVGDLSQGIHVYLQKSSSGGTVHFLLSDGVTETQLIGSSQILINFDEITHLVCTWKPGQYAEVCLNGTSCDQVATTTTVLGPFSDTATIGYVRGDYPLQYSPPSAAGTVSGTNFFEGRLDSVVIYNRTFTQTEAREHYDSRAFNPCSGDEDIVQLSTTSKVRLGPPMVGVITNSDSTLTGGCGPYNIEAQFAELSEGCDEYPRFIFCKIREAVREGREFLEGYGYQENITSDTEQTVVFEITTPSDLSRATGSGIYEGVITTTQEITTDGDIDSIEEYFVEGDQTITIPGTNYPGQVYIEVWGGGGNPAVANCYLLANIAAGGGGGGYASKVLEIPSGGLSLDISVGGTGQTSTVAISGESPFMSATGGGDGSFDIFCNQFAGEGGVGSGGDINESGEDGQTSGPTVFWDVYGGAAGDDGGERSRGDGNPPGGGAGAYSEGFSGGTKSGTGAVGGVRITILRNPAEDGYGYGYGYGDGYGYGTVTTSVVTSQVTAALCWQGNAWIVTGLAPNRTIALSNGTQYNPLMASGEVTYYNPLDLKTYHYEFSVLHYIPTDGSGTDSKFFECGNFDVGAEDPIPYSLKYTDASVVEAEYEIVGPAGVRYVPATSYDSGSGAATYRWKPDQNGKYVFRARGISENNFSTRFGNTLTYVVDIPPPEIDFYINDEMLVCLPVFGSIVAVTESSHTFKYVLDANCFGTKTVQFSLDDEEWRSNGFTTGLFTVDRLTAGPHTLRVRALDESGQYSNIATLDFYVSLQTFVTIDDYPEDPLCRPNTTATVGGTRDTHTEITRVLGVLAETLRYPTPTTWEADIALIGDGTQIIDIEVESIFGHTAKATQAIEFRTRLPKVTVSPLKSITRISKAILRGTKDSSTSIEISHNNGPWTEVVQSSSSPSWEYVLELVSAENVIQVRAVDSICGFVGDPVTVETLYADTAFVSGAFTINNGAPLTSTTRVLLTFESNTATRMKVSNFEDFREGFEVDFQESLSWTLTDNPGLKRVYVRFLDDSELESIVFSDDILLTASNQLTEISTSPHLVHALNAIDILSGNPLGTVVVIRDQRNGLFQIEIYQDAAAAREATLPLAIAVTPDEGRQTLILSDAGTGIVEVEGTIEVTTVRGAEDTCYDRKKDIWDVETGESIIPLEYSVAEDARYFYALLSLPWYESKFQGHVQEIVSTDSEEQTTIVAIDKVFRLLITESTLDNAYGYGYGYGYEKAFAQQLQNVPTPLKEQFDTYPLAGVRFWYPTLAEYSTVLEVEETPTSFLIKLDQVIEQFEDELAARIEFTKQNKYFIDYRVDKSSGVVEFINESTYATGNVQLEYEFARMNKGRPDGNWYQLCGLQFNDLISITIPQLENRITFSQLKSICTRFYNGDEGTAPQIVRFIINEAIVYEDRSSEVIEGPEGYGYSYGFTGYGYKLNKGVGDQVVEFCVDDILDNETIVDSIRIEFRATTPCMYMGEVVVNAETVPLDSNLQVVVNGKVAFTSTTPVTDQFDRYELRYEQGEVDIWYNNQFVYNVSDVSFDESAIERQFGAGARTANDKIKAEFQEVIDKKYYDTSPIGIDLIGRYVGIEPNLREEND